MDHKTIAAIEELDAKQLWLQCRVGTMEACGYVPVTTALLLAQERGYKGINVLKYAHSGDVSGDNDRVVGYTAITFSPKAGKKTAASHSQGLPALTTAQKKRLVEIAEKTVDEFVRTGKTSAIQEMDKRLWEKEGAFVTLEKDGRLRGCIGNVIGQAPLFLTVRDMAVAAAARDPRFTPVTEEELKSIHVEVSVLSKPWRIKDVAEIEPGVHGVIVRNGSRGGLFLPQVATEWGWGREELLENLCSHKAGLPADAWKDPKTEIQIFTADVFDRESLK